MAQHDPQTALECELVERLTGILWRLRRVPNGLAHREHIELARSPGARSHAGASVRLAVASRDKHQIEIKASWPPLDRSPPRAQRSHIRYRRRARPHLTSKMAAGGEHLWQRCNQRCRPLSPRTSVGLFPRHLVHPTWRRRPRVPVHNYHCS